MKSREMLFGLAALELLGAVISAWVAASDSSLFAAALAGWFLSEMGYRLRGWLKEVHAA